MENQELQDKVADLFAKTNYEVLWAVKIGDAYEFFTSENTARIASKNNEEPIKFIRTEMALKTIKTAKMDKVSILKKAKNEQITSDKS